MTEREAQNDELLERLTRLSSHDVDAVRRQQVREAAHRELARRKAPRPRAIGGLELALACGLAGAMVVWTLQTVGLLLS